MVYGSTMPTQPHQIRGDLLRQKRIDAILSQAELADRSGVKISTVKALESTDPILRRVHPRTLRNLLDFFECDASELSGIEERESA